MTSQDVIVELVRFRAARPTRCRWTDEEIRAQAPVWLRRLSWLTSEHLQEVFTDQIARGHLDLGRAVTLAKELQPYTGPRVRNPRACDLPTDPELLRQGRARIGVLSRWFTGHYRTPYSEDAERAVLRDMAEAHLPVSERAHVEGLFAIWRAEKPQLAGVTRTDGEEG